MFAKPHNKLANVLKHTTTSNDLAEIKDGSHECLAAQLQEFNPKGAGDAAEENKKQNKKQTGDSIYCEADQIRDILMSHLVILIILISSTTVSQSISLIFQLYWSLQNNGHTSSTIV